MTPQQSKRPSSRPSPRRQVSQGPGAVDKTRVLMGRLTRTVLLVIIGFTALNLAVVWLRPGNVDRLAADVAAKGTHSANLTTYAHLSLGFAVLCAVLMLLLGLNVSFLHDRLFPRPAAGWVYAATLAVGVVGISLGLAGATGFGVMVVVGLLPAIVSFVVISLMAPGFLGNRTAGGSRTRPVRRRPDARSDTTDAPPSAPRQKSRQRRGGRPR